MGEAVPTSTATTVEGANAADEEPSSKFQINTSGGVASQSATSKGGETVHTGPGGAMSRATTGAGDAPHISGRK